MQTSAQINEYVAKEPLIQLDIGVALGRGEPMEAAIRGWWTLNGAPSVEIPPGVGETRSANCRRVPS